MSIRTARAYPWSGMDRSLLTQRMSEDPRSPTIHVGEDWDWGDEAEKDASYDIASTLARWLQGGRRLVSISEQSMRLLVEGERRLNKAPHCRDDKPWKLGYMLRFWDYVAYIEPATSTIGRGVRISAWHWDGGMWLPVGFRSRGRGAFRAFEVLDYRTESEERKLAWSVNGTRIDAALLRQVVVNAFATLHAIPDIAIAKKTKRKGRKRTTTVGGVRGVKRLTLNESGTRLAMTKWTRSETEARASSTHTVGLHHVDQHHWRVWVNTPKAHEHILATRTGTNGDGETYTQFRVRRLRGPKDGYVRGSGPLKVKKATMVTGIDDAGGE